MKLLWDPKDKQTVDMAAVAFPWEQLKAYNVNLPYRHALFLGAHVGSIAMKLRDQEFINSGTLVEGHFDTYVRQLRALEANRMEQHFRPIYAIVNEEGGAFSSRLKDFPGGNTGMQGTHHPGNPSKTAPCLSLLQLLSFIHPDLLVIDIEGSEYGTVLGCLQLWMTLHLAPDIVIDLHKPLHPDLLRLVPKDRHDRPDLWLLEEIQKLGWKQIHRDTEPEGCAILVWPGKTK
jgi:hypothetical protein